MTVPVNRAKLYMDTARIEVELKRTFGSVRLRAVPELGDGVKAGAVYYTAVADGRKATVGVSQDLVNDPVFPLKDALLEQFRERLSPPAPSPPNIGSPQIGLKLAVLVLLGIDRKAVRKRTPALAPYKCSTLAFVPWT